MEVIVTKVFSKQLKQCPAYIRESVRAILESLEAASHLNDVPDIKKLEGYKFYYRIRIGDYRIGLKQEKPRL